MLLKKQLMRLDYKDHFNNIKEPLHRGFFFINYNKYLLIIYFFILNIFFSDLLGVEIRNNPYLKMDYFFESIENNSSYKINISDLNTEIIIFGEPVSGAKVNVYYDDLIIKKDHDIKKYLKVYDNKKSKVITIKNKIENSKTNPVKMILQIPENIDLNISNCVDKVSIDNILGTINILNHSGIIDITSMIGNLDVLASESEINITNSKLQSNLETKGFSLTLINNVGNSNITTTGSDIFLNNHIGDLKIFSNSGILSIKTLIGKFSNFKTNGELILIEDAKTNLDISNQLGDLDLKNITGSIRANTNNGNISINKYYGNLLINTNSGDVFLEDIIGSTDISSNLGNIKCKLNYKSSFKNSFHSIETIEGDINIKIPKKLSMSLASQIASNRSTQDITSEIPLKFLVEDEKIVGRAFINDGTIPINLYSKNGFISIKDY